MTTKVLREVRSIIEAEGLVEDACVNGGRHIKITARDPATGFTGMIVVHLGTKVKSRMAPSIRSMARSIRRGQ